MFINFILILHLFSVKIDTGFTDEPVSSKPVYKEKNAL